MVRMTTIEQQNFLSPIQSWSANFQKNCSPIQPKLTSVLIRAHLCTTV